MQIKVEVTYSDEEDALDMIVRGTNPRDERERRAQMLILQSLPRPKDVFREPPPGPRMTVVK